MASELEQRKADHINAVLHGDVRARRTSGLENVRFSHVALPELNFDDINLSVDFLGHVLRAPIMVSAMTGGLGIAKNINETIAEVCQDLGIGFAVGSQRIALEQNIYHGLGKNIRRLAPTVPIMANIGASQLKSLNKSGSLPKLVEMIEADALIVHLNPLQEVLQQDGDKDWSGVLKQLETAVKTITQPIIIKEVGFGISSPVAEKLWNVGIKIIDVAGSGGTSWAAVEAARAPDQYRQEIAETFRDWGISTALSIQMVKQVNQPFLIIASGGLRTGLEAAQALRLGASVTGFAAILLPAAVNGVDSLHKAISKLITELKITAFCTGSSTITELKQATLIDVSLP
jgi:isopentenyl-diphosphate Delta-isomerase